MYPAVSSSAVRMSGTVGPRPFTYCSVTMTGTSSRWQRRLAAKKSAHVRGGDARHRAARLVCRGADVRRDHDIRHRQQPRVDARLVLEDVKPGAAEVMSGEGVAKRVFVDDRAARGV